MPTFFKDKIYYANPKNIPTKDENSETIPTKWLNVTGDVVFMPEKNTKLCGLKNRNWTEMKLKY